MFVIKRSTNQKIVKDAQIKNLQSRKELSHPHLIPLVDISFDEENKMCSQIFVVQAKYEYLSNSLYKETERRKKSKDYFLAI